MVRVILLAVLGFICGATIGSKSVYDEVNVMFVLFRRGGFGCKEDLLRKIECPTNTMTKLSG